MKTLRAALLIAVVGLSFIFIGNSTVKAKTAAANDPVQVVPTTKRISRNVYRKGRWVTVTTWRHGKRITKKVWRKGWAIGRKTGHKTREIVMGPSRRRP